MILNFLIIVIFLAQYDFYINGNLLNYQLIVLISGHVASTDSTLSITFYDLIRNQSLTLSVREALQRYQTHRFVWRCEGGVPIVEGWEIAAKTIWGLK